MNKHPTCLKAILNISFSLFIIPCLAQSPNWLWAKTVTGTYGICWPEAMVTDSSGNCYVAGIYDGYHVIFDTTTLYNTGNPLYSINEDAFLVKYDTNGNVVWAKGFGGTYGDWVNSIALDVSGNIYMVGSYSFSSISFDSIILPTNGGTEMFLVKYNSNGIPLWAKNAGSNACSALSVKIGTSGNIYISGGFISDSISFGSYNLYNANLHASYDFFIVKYNSDGNVIWAKSAGGDEDEFSYSLDLDNSDNVYVTGTFNSDSFHIGCDTLVRAGGQYLENDVFLAKFDSDGNPVWARSFGGTGDDIVNSSATDHSGNTFLAGSFKSSSISFGASILTNADVNYSDIFFAKYDSNGQAIWAKSYGGNYTDGASDVEIDNSGNVYFIGSYFSSNMIFGSCTLTHYPLFVVKYDNSGNLLWARDSDSPGAYGFQTTVDPSGNIFTGGSIATDSILFGTTTLHNNAIDFGYFIAKLSDLPVHITQTNVSCYDGNNGTATATFTTGIPPFTYLWNTVPPQTNQTATGLAYGTYTVTVTDSTGVSSVANVYITQAAEIHSSFQQTICTGDTFNFNGHQLSNAGIYYDTISTANNCDSIIKLSLTIDYQDTTYQLNVICQGSIYNFYETSLTSAGIYYHTLISSHGCDSVIQLNLALYPIDTTIQSNTICQGSYYNFYGTILDTAGVYYHTLLSSHGCDSLIITELTENPLPQITVSDDTSVFIGIGIGA
ncbi:MAG: hypothetical protein NTU44_16130 [Bacteroidetes bacterium]|nr:hypothetical protein [Bacteroidota bacterium]